MNTQRYVRAASIIETVIAITIITICSLIAILVYSSVIDATPPLKQYELKYTMEKLIEEALENKDVVPYTKKYDGYRIEKTVLFRAPHDLYTVTFRVVSEKNSLERKILIYRRDVEN